MWRATSFSMASTVNSRSASITLGTSPRASLNRPVKMTNSTKAAVWTAVWQPWGAAQSITGSATLNARFPGQWFQVEAGLHYNWHRHYDPSLGRYTQPDPLGFVDGPSVYGYVRGAPQVYVDPDGRFVWTLPGIKLVAQNVVWPTVRPYVVPTLTTLITALKNGGGRGGGGKPPSGSGRDCPDDDECDEQDREDRACCMSQIILRKRAQCHNQASERTHACNNKRYIPPLGFCGR